MRKAQFQTLLRDTCRLTLMFVHIALVASLSFSAIQILLILIRAPSRLLYSPFSANVSDSPFTFEGTCSSCMSTSFAFKLRQSHIRAPSPLLYSTFYANVSDAPFTFEDICSSPNVYRTSNIGGKQNLRQSVSSSCAWRVYITHIVFCSKAYIHQNISFVEIRTTALQSFV